MNTNALDIYCNLMDEIKKRDFVIRSILKMEHSTPYKATNIELMCLQIRKILELIALGSLVANKDLFTDEQEKIGKLWHAELILKDIERLNPQFYPNPIKEEKQEDFTNISGIDKPYLTRKKFIKVYDKCGALMHAENPFGSKKDYSYYEKNIPTWMTEIVTLLNSHTLKLIGDTILYIVHMDKSGNKPRYYTFELVSDLETADNPTK